jgi:hypothetical protein
MGVIPASGSTMKERPDGAAVLVVVVGLVVDDVVVLVRSVVLVALPPARVVAVGAVPQAMSTSASGPVISSAAVRFAHLALEQSRA